MHDSNPKTIFVSMLHFHTETELSCVYVLLCKEFHLLSLFMCMCCYCNSSYIKTHKSI